jgi:mannose/fructose-specific phosphotransferase system component IIA
MTDLVLVTHFGVGEAIKQAAESIYGPCSRVTVFDLRSNEAHDPMLARLVAHLRRACSTSPVLILTDLPGATPHNTACDAARTACPGSPVVTGLNLPMLLRALNHAEKPAGELAEIAVTGGLRSVFSGGSNVGH